MQSEISREAVFSDRIDLEISNSTVAGVDQAFTDDKAVSGVVVMEEGEVLEKRHGVKELGMPYIPGLLAFREAPSIVDALSSLKKEPDLLLLDGSGRIHFREAGIAVHVGVLYDLPAVGVAKNLLCGEAEESMGSLEEGEKVAVRADNSVETADGELIGYAYQSKQNARGINPLYISSGHRVTAETAVELVADHCRGYKLPEPVRKADSYVDDVKQQLG